MSGAALPIGFGTIAAGTLLGVAGVTGSSLASVLRGKPDKTRPAPQLGGVASAAGSAPIPSSGASVPANAQGLANPHPGFTKGRVDQGVDFAGQPGAPIYAIAPGRVLGIIPNWFKGQPFLYYEVTAGTLKGQVLYVAEQIVPHVKPGDRFAAGQQIATYASAGTAIEEGFATRSGRTLAAATTGYSEGQETVAGSRFRALIERIGGKV